MLYSQSCLDDATNGNVLAKYVPTAVPWEQGWQRLSDLQLDAPAIGGGISLQQSSTNPIITGMALPLVRRELVDMAANGFSAEMVAR